MGQKLPPAASAGDFLGRQHFLADWPDFPFPAFCSASHSGVRLHGGTGMAGRETAGENKEKS